MKEIIINSPKHGIIKTIVDDDNYDWLNQWKWSVKPNKDADNFYIIRSDKSTGKKITVWMARLILGITNPKIYVDHKDHNTINNVRSNLRASTIRQNGENKRKIAPAFSKFKGVHQHIQKQGDKTYTYFRAKIRVNYEQKSLGLYKTEIEAAMAYNKAALQFHGEYAHLNTF